MTHTVYILGSGQDAGLPQFGARHAQDTLARADRSRVRLGPSLAVTGTTGDGANYPVLLIDASPDIKEQESRLMTTPEFAGRRAADVSAGRLSAFDAVLLTHAHMGHYAGLIHFGREAANTKNVFCYCSAKMNDFLRKNAPWNQLVDLNNISPQVKLPGIKFFPVPLVTKIEVFAVPHRGEYTDTWGVSLNGKLLYVPDIDDWKQWPEARAQVERHEICLLDATFFSPDELPGRNLKEISHPFARDTIKFFGDLVGKPTASGAKRRIVLTHLNHSNPLCDPDSAASKEVKAAGFEIAQEMQKFEI